MSRILSFGLITALLLAAMGCGDKTTDEVVKTPPGDGPDEDPPMDISKLPKDLQPLAEKVQAAGGSIEIETTDEGESRTLYLSNTQNTDQLLAEAKKYPSITRVYLTNSSVTDEGLRHIAAMENVTYLNLDTSGQSAMQLSDAGLKHLEKSKGLKKLTLLGNHSFSNAALDALKEAKGGGDGILITKPN